MIFKKTLLRIATFFLITHFLPLSSQNSGLPNTKNVCYINSFFQCFTNLELVRNLLINNQDLYKKPSVPFDFIELIKNIRKNPSTPYEPKECVDQFINETFKQKIQQQDCQEALSRFIGEYLMNNDQFLIKNQNLAKAIQDYTTMCEVNTSLLTDKSYLFLKTFCDLIYFTDEGTISCPDSKSHVAIKKEKNITLSLDIVTCKSLQDCLTQRYLGKEILDNNNTWFCSDCKKHVNATKEFKLIDIPKYLLIHFKRFDNKNKKITTNVRYPVDGLDVRMFMSKQAQENYKDKSTTYNLIGVISHIGNSNQNGHYIAFVKDFESKQWYVYNDATVTAINEKTIKDLSKKGKDSYILFYELVETKDQKKFEGKKPTMPPFPEKKNARTFSEFSEDNADVNPEEADDFFNFMINKKTKLNTEKPEEKNTTENIKTPDTKKTTDTNTSENTKIEILYCRSGS